MNIKGRDGIRFNKKCFLYFSHMDVELLNYLRGYLTEKRLRLFKEVLVQRTRHFTVVTEDVYQLHNTSAVLRNCDVFGIQDLHVVEESLGKKMDREIAMGAQKWVDVHRYQKIEDCIDTVKKEGYQIIATTPHNDSQLLEDFDVKKKSALFFGRETEGVSDSVLKAADGFLKIPMYGFTESLNISVSAAIILQDVVSRLRKTDIDWKLSEKEKFDLEIQWVKKTIKRAEGIIQRFQEKKNDP